ncbi:MAG: neutral/alkaline non-lysosomal ceramidase N-terminal domain-containing protein [Planctomycetota bacterium]
MRRAVSVLTLAFFMATSPRSFGAETLEVGLGAEDITPEIKPGKPVYIAGYGQNRLATGVHDPLFARAVVFRAGDAKVAVVSVDLVGLQYPAVQRIREKLDGFTYVLVSSTHTHEGPDVIGIWGESPLKSGLDPEYIMQVENGVVNAVRKADSAAAPAVAEYGTATDESLLRDSRVPIVYDGVIRVLKFKHAETKKPLGILVQWNNHPEAMGSENTLITCDFPWATIAALEKKYQCPVAYFTGTVGGLMTTLRTIKDPETGKELHEENFEYTEVYGKMVASLAEKAMGQAQPINLTPIRVSTKQVGVPLSNLAYHLMWSMNVLPRDAYEWTGDANKVGPPINRKGGKKGVKGALLTEVSYIRLGDLHIAGIPGEIYPEIVYGKYQEPVEPNVDFPDAPLETPVVKVLPGDKIMLFGLANDEVGYILPKRQWDSKPPFAYGRKEQQYGEVNSVGPETGPILMKALEDAVDAVKEK